MASKASSRSGSTARICPATVERGSRPNASTGPSLSSWDGRTRKGRDLMSAPSCSVTSSRMDGWFTRPRRHGHEPEDARDATQAPPAAGDQENASRRSPASRKSVREAAGVGQGSLGPARTGRRNYLSELAGRRPSSSHGFRRLARGQTCERGQAGDATGAVVVSHTVERSPPPARSWP